MLLKIKQKDGEAIVNTKNITLFEKIDFNGETASEDLPESLKNIIVYSLFIDNRSFDFDTKEERDKYYNTILKSLILFNGKIKEIKNEN